MRTHCGVGRPGFLARAILHLLQLEKFYSSASRAALGLESIFRKVIFGTFLQSEVGGMVRFHLPPLEIQKTAAGRTSRGLDRIPGKHGFGTF
ncbi:hypothetical protein FQZ97_1060650 [compost metagenome]